MRSRVALRLDRPGAALEAIERAVAVAGPADQPSRKSCCRRAPCRQSSTICLPTARTLPKRAW